MPLTISPECYVVEQGGGFPDPALKGGRLMCHLSGYRRGELASSILSALRPVLGIYLLLEARNLGLDGGRGCYCMLRRRRVRGSSVIERSSLAR